jgi:hypothetical protein
VVVCPVALNLEVERGKPLVHHGYYYIILIHKMWAINYKCMATFEIKISILPLDYQMVKIVVRKENASK